MHFLSFSLQPQIDYAGEVREILEPFEDAEEEEESEGEITDIFDVDDNEQLVEHKTFDSAGLRHIQWFIEEIRRIFIRYSPKVSEITLDEHLLALKNRVGFKMFFKDKPRKYGICFRSVNDALSTYLLNFKMLTGRYGDE